MTHSSGGRGDGNLDLEVKRNGKKEVILMEKDSRI